MFQVYQDDKPADSKNYPSIQGFGWSNSTFENKREAEIYAFLWACPLSLEEAKIAAPHMRIGIEYDYGMTEVPVHMSIHKIKNDE